MDTDKIIEAFMEGERVYWLDGKVHRLVRSLDQLNELINKNYELEIIG